MKVHIEGGLRKSKYPYGESYYMIVRDDIKDKKVFCYVNEHRVNGDVKSGELREVVPGWTSKIPWKYVNKFGETCIFGTNENDWYDWREKRGRKL